ncbi:hypothetical protein CH63R_12073 [Colletotrichum higginsianum IMI 349063]|uniref:Uncharacterized protein n=1 Tax=Colletotrichum higginsianum (strain IMI 349063) TaxID=759273 RepID=A0A1B7Y044_COLHI|nr:hypothetical protein CH63R_12073 [Colletotrichum higginsianum IMI 349063]OBR05370.1 hypothetical protein CH63R_12073 [Colletotrichum higginsianum IMI 349063]
MFPRADTFARLAMRCDGNNWARVKSGEATISHLSLSLSPRGNGRRKADVSQLMGEFPFHKLLVSSLGRRLRDPFLQCRIDLGHVILDSTRFEPPAGFIEA